MTSDDEVARQVRDALAASAQNIQPNIPPVEDLPQPGRRRGPRTSNRRRWAFVTLPLAAAAVIAAVVLVSTNLQPGATKVNVVSPSHTAKAHHPKQPPRRSTTPKVTTPNTTRTPRTRTSTPTSTSPPTTQGTRSPAVTTTVPPTSPTTGTGGGGTVPVTTPTTSGHGAGTSPTTTTPPTTVGRCTTSQLAFSYVKQGSAASQPAAYFAFKQIAGPTCTLYGYPGLQLVTTTGKTITLTLYRGSTMLISNPGPHTVTLKRGTTVYFGFGWEPDNPTTGSTNGCPQIASAKSIPPNDYQQLTATAPLEGVLCGAKGTITAVGTTGSFAKSALHP